MPRGDASKNPDVDWSMSAALENVVRGEQDLAEVANLAGVVRDWLGHDPEHRGSAVLTPERPILIDGAAHASVTAVGIGRLAVRLPARWAAMSWTATTVCPCRARALESPDRRGVSDDGELALARCCGRCCCMAEMACGLGAALRGRRERMRPVRIST